MKITINNLNDIYHAKQASVETMELKGYELLQELFVDSSGFGTDDELAYTQEKFLNKVKEWLDIHSSLTAKITNVGQFQVYVGLFIKNGKSKVKKIANNTYRVDYGNKEAIRLHDTNIITYDHDKFNIILNSGGYQTRTTKDRLNKYLPYGVSIEQKNFEWFVVDTRNSMGLAKVPNSRVEFRDGMTIAS